MLPARIISRTASGRFCSDVGSIVGEIFIDFALARAALGGVLTLRLFVYALYFIVRGSAESVSIIIAADIAGDWRHDCEGASW